MPEFDLEPVGAEAEDNDDPVSAMLTSVWLT